MGLHMRRTKMIATVGPATAGPAHLQELIRAGVDCLRFNFSHGVAEEHAAVMRSARRCAQRAGRRVALLADLCGPKIRTGPAPEGGVRLVPGSRLRLEPGQAETRPDRVCVSYPSFAREVHPGQRILLADGRMELVAEGRKAGAVLARVKIGGMLGARKGVNLPGADLSTPALTRKDRADLAAAAAARPDYVALSFVRSAKDLEECRAAMRRCGLSKALLIAKIETPEALERIDAVLGACDGIMVARGDLGVELPQEEVPAIQRRLLRLAAERDRIGIVATEMLESMTASPRPTRAEVSDVACAVRDGADAAMLSAETSTGKYPVLAARWMGKTLASAEESLRASGELSSAAACSTAGGKEDILSVGARLVSRELKGAVLVAATESGRTAFYLSKCRPDGAILGMSPSDHALDRMALYWGVLPVRCPRYRRHADLMVAAARAAAKHAKARKGAPVVTLSGTPLGRSGNTNTLHLLRV